MFSATQMGSSSACKTRKGTLISETKRSLIQKSNDDDNERYVLPRDIPVKGMARVVPTDFSSDMVVKLKH